MPGLQRTHLVALSGCGISDLRAFHDVLPAFFPRLAGGMLGVALLPAARPGGHGCRNPAAAGLVYPPGTGCRCGVCRFTTWSRAWRLGVADRAKSGGAIAPGRCLGCCRAAADRRGLLAGAAAHGNGNGGCEAAGPAGGMAGFAADGPGALSGGYRGGALRDKTDLVALKGGTCGAVGG